MKLNILDDWEYRRTERETDVKHQKLNSQMNLERDLPVRSCLEHFPRSWVLSPRSCCRCRYLDKIALRISAGISSHPASFPGLGWIGRHTSTSLLVFPPENTSKEDPLDEARSESPARIWAMNVGVSPVWKGAKSQFSVDGEEERFGVSFARR